jgi:hypothetical protein
MAMWPLIIDVALAGVLFTTLVYLVKLNGRLAALRDDRDQLQELIRGLQTATGNAEDAVGGLRLAAGDAGRALQDAVDRATALRNDLGFVIERADVAANRLEAALRANREAPSAGGFGEETRRRARADVEPTIESILEPEDQSRLAMLLKQAEKGPVPEPTRTPTPVRSRAERDLLKALEKRR